VERIIGMQDDLTIAGLCKGIDTVAAEEKGMQMRRVLERMKVRSRKSARGS
jgi:hypothetical protein